MENRPPPPAPPTAAPEASGIPWEGPAGREAPARAAWETWRESVFRPSAFFARLSPDGPLGRAIAFLIVFGMLGSILSLGWQMVLGGDALAEMLPAGMGAVTLALLWLVVTPVVLVIGLLIWGGILHLCLLVVGGAGAGFRGTLRTVSYTAGPQVFTIVPFLGGLVAAGWSLVLVLVGLTQVHRTALWKAAFAVFLPIGLLLVGVVVAVALALALGLVAT